MVRIYKYRSTLNIDYWKSHLSKAKLKFTSSDKKLFKKVKSEKDDNIAIKDIYELAKKDNLHIPKLSGLEGDCLFESIEINCQEQKYNLIKNKDDLRKEIATIFYLSGDCKVIPNNDMTLKEIFEAMNDIEYVYCDKNELLYKYTYYTMCVDMFNEGSWSRLPTELLLRVMSSIYNMKFHIYHNSGDISHIDNTDKTNSKKKKIYNIYLGLIDEDHYIPLKPNPNNDKWIDNYVVPKYSIQSEKFHKWAKKIAGQVGLYEDIDTDTDNESESDNEAETEADNEAKTESDNESDTHTDREIKTNNKEHDKNGTIDDEQQFNNKRKKKVTNKHITTKTINNTPDILVMF
jgi:hypothetical protein